MERQAEMDLNGKLLIAMPGMADPRFEGSVVLICTHSAEGTMGLIINKPVPDLTFESLMEQLELHHEKGAHSPLVYFGGPVERARGFVLHSSDYAMQEATMQISAPFAMTGTQDILSALGRGEGPCQALLALGYAGWGPGQLESELLRNDWLTAEADSDLVFSVEDNAKWARALRAMGVEPSALSSLAGRA